jgi:spore coat polysaccharide biosynthesis protein SpsF
VATSDQPTDDPIAAWCAAQGVTVFRGDLDNVAARTQACLKRFPCDAFFRINADSPFLQADLLSQAIEVFERHQPDMVTNVLERSYPYGIAVELVKSETFLKHAPEFKGDENEHITSHFYRRREQFKIENIRNNEDLSSKRFVLDTREDWENLQRLYLRDQNIFNYNLSQLIKSTQN